MQLKIKKRPLDLVNKDREIKKKPQLRDLNYFIGESYFDDDGSQNYLIFQPSFRSFKTFTGSVDNFFWMEI